MKVTGKAEGKASPGGCKGIKDLAGTEIHTCKDLVGKHGDLVHNKSGDGMPHSL